MSIETFEYRGAVITLDYDGYALCPIEGAGSWAEGVVYSIAVALPDGEVEVTGGVYFESGYPDEGEVIEFVESILTWDNPADNESEDDATGGAVVSVKVSDAVRNLGGAGFSAGEVGFILGVLGAGV